MVNDKKFTIKGHRCRCFYVFKGTSRSNEVPFVDWGQDGKERQVIAAFHSKLYYAFEFSKHVQVLFQKKY